MGKRGRKGVKYLNLWAPPGKSGNLGDKTVDFIDVSLYK